MGKYAKVNTDVPGPKSQALLEKRKKYVPKGISNGCLAFAKNAKGALIEDIDGNTFIDFAGAIGTINVGHSHPKVVKAIQEQAENFIHTGFNVFLYDSYIELAEKLIELAPGDFPKQAAFFNSGAEAVENAVKIARKYTKRQGIISFTRGFHGRTLMTMTMTSKVKPYKYEFGPFAPEVYRAPYPYIYRRPDGMKEEQYSQYVIEQFENFLITDVDPNTIAAVVMEPVQGEGGFIIPDKAFVQRVRELCSQYGILFVADEIQTGFGRTGRYFAIDHFDVVPDLITISKSLAAGVPISGVIGRAEIMDAASPGEIGGTYAGSPLGCKAALAVLDIIESENLNNRAQEIGKKIMDKFNELESRFEQVDGSRGLGAMCAFEIVKDKKSKAPDKEAVGRIIEEAQNRGLLLLSAGIYSNVIRILVPLVITDEQLEEGLTILEQSIETVLEKQHV
ncbi:MAG: 4-aminobutyrate--2-oxoglutarate transaminase [Bacillaceae bacterium]|jgi:4-aminobutyrate aminotransferase, prokaryotic type|uniref:(S)-3-amino-2-methylpropionate transaminase n=1 Tax=Aeribacillus pallidus TaxID=33936 RepID=A0A165Z1X3_9BACI|nr:MULTISPECIES: 4-aminobutyrate--2-oxoglutarate transaminase [Aeribacillus]KZN97729.1 4-aminobutyrate--2-oxoglutarate transaminase [Aeribacillus pallidus]MED1439040.1 4-aminobutyrate--2-oxoglutarate transaminase [Aeribacillus composti]REJ16938.1 MAG: 4-aminobutyrate--2-oxoglutarate transaminase [Bacillaceae bacterium]